MCFCFENGFFNIHYNIILTYKIQISANDAKSISIVFVLLVMILVYTIPVAYAEKDDDDEDREGFGEMKREREHQDEGIPIGTDMGNVILYGTIVAIGAYVAYTVFKITSSKRKSNSKS